MPQEEFAADTSRRRNQDVVLPFKFIIVALVVFGLCSGASANQSLAKVPSRPLGSSVSWRARGVGEISERERMIDVLVLVGVAARLESWLKSLLERDAATKAQWKHAVEILQDAVIKTQEYVAKLDRGTLVDHDKQADLSRAWQRASAAFYGLDGHSAERLQLKAEYWLHPEDWTDQQVADANISLQRVTEYTRQLLRESA